MAKTKHKKTKRPVLTEKERMEKERLSKLDTARIHRDHPPVHTARDQTEGFTEVLRRLYLIEDKVIGPGDADQRALFAEARSICERFLPPQLVATMRKANE